MFDYVLNGTCVISLQFSRVEFTANHEFVPATFHCERKNKSSVILKPVSCVMFPISDRGGYGFLCRVQKNFVKERLLARP